MQSNDPGQVNRGMILDGLTEGKDIGPSIG